MSPILKRVVVSCVAAVLLLLGWWTYSRVYASPRDELNAEITSIRSAMVKLDKQRDLKNDATAILQSLGTTTLGEQLDVVEHRLRTGLSRVMEQEGMVGITIDTYEPVSVDNPLIRTRGMPTALKKQLNAKSDFTSIRASVKATGSLEQAAKSIAALQAQPWVHRFDSVSVKPVGKARVKFEVKADVATLYVPDLRPDELGELPIAVPPEEMLTYAQAIGERNLFLRPEPPAAIAQNPNPPTPPAEVPVAIPTSAPPPPYEDWLLSGVMSGRSGLTIIVLNSKSGEAVTLRQGEAVLDAVLIDGQGERAVFQIQGQRFEVSNGETLASRRPVG